MSDAKDAYDIAVRARPIEPDGDIEIDEEWEGIKKQRINMTVREAILADKQWSGYPHIVARCETIEELFEAIMLCHWPQDKAEKLWFAKISRLAFDDINAGKTAYSEGIWNLYNNIISILKEEYTGQKMQVYLATLRAATISTLQLMNILAAEAGYTLPQPALEFSKYDLRGEKEDEMMEREKIDMIDLRLLKDAADEACIAAAAAVKQPLEAINWGDLHCISAKRTEDEDGNIEHEVLIEEASPLSYELQEFIRNFLREKGFKGVDVITEW